MQERNLSQLATPRESAFFALCRFLKEEEMLLNSLQEWQKQFHPSPQDFRLAQEIAYGTARMALTLDWIGEKLASKRSLKLKGKEKVLLRMSLYQLYYLDRVPSYATVHEMVSLAKRYTHITFASFLNALLRKAALQMPALPKQNLSLTYSYPTFLVECLSAQYGREKTKKILELGNTAPKQWVRTRNKNPLEFQQVDDIDPFISSKQHYIQNPTQANLLVELVKNIPPPKNILDLCASPGGKSILLKELFREAHLTVNDRSEEKLNTLANNLEKYGIDAFFSCGPAEEFQADGQFDLVLVDAPCSNSGVLGKRPEARWRISKENIEKLQKTQLAILERASSLVARSGTLIYMTCSILAQENEEVAKNCSLQAVANQLKTPEAGLDGGFGAVFSKRDVGQT